MAKKKKKSEEELQELVEECAKRYVRWTNLRTNGGADRTGVTA